MTGSSRERPEPALQGEHPEQHDERSAPRTGGIEHRPREEGTASRKQIAESLAHRGQIGGLRGAPRAQSDEDERDRQCRPEPDAQQHGPEQRIGVRRHQQPQGADAAHQGRGERPPSLVPSAGREARRDERHRDPDSEHGEQQVATANRREP